jgi:CrcB protein
MNLLFVCIGGVIGALGRYYFSLVFSRLFPKMKNYVSTLFINGIGSFALGSIVAIFIDSTGSYSNMALGIMVGMIGSFTTFSTFALDCVKILQQKEWIQGIAYIVCTLFISIGLFYIGFFIKAVFA